MPVSGSRWLGPARLPGVRAVVYDRTGGPEVLRLVDKPLLDPGPDEVRVRIHRSGVNPTDWKTRRGTDPVLPVDPPQTPNQDGSGVVDAVGPGGDAGLVGQRVWVWEAAYHRPEGTAQDFALVPTNRVVPLPDSASFDLGASLGVPFVTARRCLTVNEDAPDRLFAGSLAGRAVLVAGGAGAVGNAAIQLARWAGATVVTTVSGPEKAELARAAGADHVVDYRRQDVVTEVRRVAPDGVNTIVEVAPAVNAAIDVGVVAANGSVAIYANDRGAELVLPVRPLMVVNARWHFVLMYTAYAPAMAAGVQDLSAALRDGALRVGPEAGMPLHHYPLEQAARAHAAVEEAVIGKVLIDVTE